jgi:tRNA-dependent cyclodipeptide synthase
MATSKWIIKASFKDCPVQDRKSFLKSHCLMPISVGQMVHEGEKFTATLELINRSFSECTVLVDDTLQRHTYKIASEDETDLELYNKALTEGDRWLKRNIHAVQQLTLKYSVIRWDDWLKHPDYLDQRAKIEHSYRHDTHYTQAIDATIATFLNRYKRVKSLISYEKAFECCLDYLKEECACMCLWALQGYHFEVYPTGRSEAMRKTHELFIQPIRADILKSVSLRFKKYTQKNSIS